MNGVRVRRAGIGDAGIVAGMLHDFNTEFDTDSPGPIVLAPGCGRCWPAPTPSHCSAASLRPALRS